MYKRDKREHFASLCPCIISHSLILFRDRGSSFPLGHVFICTEWHALDLTTETEKSERKKSKCFVHGSVSYDFSWYSFAPTLLFLGHIWVYLANFGKFSAILPNMEEYALFTSPVPLYHFETLI